MRKLLNILIFGLFVWQCFVFSMEKTGSKADEQSIFQYTDIKNKILDIILDQRSFREDLKLVNSHSVKISNNSLTRAKLVPVYGGKLMVITGGGCVRKLNPNNITNQSETNKPISEANKPIISFNFPADTSVLAGSPTGKTIAVGTKSGKVRVYSCPNNSNESFEFKCCTSDIKKIHFTSDKQLFTFSQESDHNLAMQVWNLSEKGAQRLRYIKISGGEINKGIYDIAVDSTGENAVALGKKLIIHIKNVQENVQEQEKISISSPEFWAEGNTQVFRSMSFGPNDVIAIRLYDGNADSITICYDLKSRAIISTIPNKGKNCLTSMSFSPNGKMVALLEDGGSFSNDMLSKYCTILDVETGRPLYSFRFPDYYFFDSNHFRDSSAVEFIDNTRIGVLRSGAGLIEIYQLPNWSFDTPNWSLDILQANLVSRILGTKRDVRYGDWKTLQSIKESFPTGYNFLQGNVALRDILQLDLVNSMLATEKNKKFYMDPNGWETFKLIQEDYPGFCHYLKANVRMGWHTNKPKEEIIEKNYPGFCQYLKDSVSMLWYTKKPKKEIINNDLQKNNLLNKEQLIFVDRCILTKVGDDMSPADCKTFETMKVSHPALCEYLSKNDYAKQPTFWQRNRRVLFEAAATAITCGIVYGGFIYYLAANNYKDVEDFVEHLKDLIERIRRILTFLPVRP